MTKIKEIRASEILDSKGFPTVEATIVLENDSITTASCPNGEKIGHYEAVDLKDDDVNSFDGHGVKKAIENIKNIIAPQLIGKDAVNQSEIDKTMIDLDGTQNKSRLGGNATLAVSMAVAKAGARAANLPPYLYLKQYLKKGAAVNRIPIPIFNLINGKNKGNRFADFNEFLIVPASSKQYLDTLQIGETIRKALRQLIDSKFSGATNDYEDNFVLDLSSNKEAFALIQQAITNTNVKLGFDVFFGLNCRASTFFKDGKYYIKDNQTSLSAKELIGYYEELNNNIHLLYLEDPLDQDDWEGWSTLFSKLSSTTMIVGGDLIATNLLRLQMALQKKAANALIIKPSQSGTVIESLAIAEIAKELGFKTIVSHRSNETNDDFLADFAVAIEADYIKIGSLARGENIAKYNRLLQIENQLKIL